MLILYFRKPKCFVRNITPTLDFPTNVNHNDNNTQFVDQHQRVFNRVTETTVKIKPYILTGPRPTKFII